ncbi:hypothetical protein F5B17DRAFT_113519 [Nemania serpens]|nr:hypothetical protein F5B17DRAFT_113519 [Nemania serpens]
MSVFFSFCCCFLLLFNSNVSRNGSRCQFPGSKQEEGCSLQRPVLERKKKDGTLQVSFSCYTPYDVSRHTLNPYTHLVCRSRCSMDGTTLSPRESPKVSTSIDLLFCLLLQASLAGPV